MTCATKKRAISTISSGIVLMPQDCFAMGLSINKTNQRLRSDGAENSNDRRPRRKCFSTSVAESRILKLPNYNECEMPMLVCDIIFEQLDMQRIRVSIPVK
jgi:hypothetical protein